MIPRLIESTLRELAGSFRSIAIVGPRQSGKTTLARSVFPDKPYVSLEHPVNRQYALNDPVSFLAQYPDGAVIDEAQHAPDLFSYLQLILDEANRPGHFILTGSNNFLLLEKITQSLAGRIAYLDLLPFSVRETDLALRPSEHIDGYLFRGGYPGVVAQGADPEKWYSSYIRSYIERDVRQIKNLGNLDLFGKLLSLCAGRVGQQLNLSSLGIEAGVDHKTIQSWIGLMQASYILFLLPPYFRNFNKRIVKSPKLYFYDTGLVCNLLRITSEQDLSSHPFRGALVENFLITEILKNRYNHGKRSNLFYWRDSAGHEVDLLIDQGQELLPVEVKSGQTITDDYFKGLNYFMKLSGCKESSILYLGKIRQVRSNGTIVRPWREVVDL